MTLAKIKKDDNLRDHLNEFFNTVENFENFRCNIESRDAPPNPDALRIKIVEEYEARNAKDTTEHTEAFYIKRQYVPKENQRKFAKKKDHFQYRCNRCHAFGHRAFECRAPAPVFRESARQIDEDEIYVHEEPIDSTDETHQTMYLARDGDKPYVRFKNH